MTLSSIFSVFGPSPIKPLEKHMDIVLDCVTLLRPLLTEMGQENWEAAEKIRLEISDLETKADDIKRDLRLSLPKGLFMAVPRKGLLECLTAQDRIANKAQDIANLLMGRKLIIPSPVLELYLSLLEHSIQACALARKAINELDELLETGFTEKVVVLVEDMIKKLNVIEHDTEECQEQCRALLFQYEEGIPPVDVIFLYKTIEWTGDLAERAQLVGGLLQALLH